MNYLITEEQLVLLTNKVKKLTEGTVSVKDPKYTLTAKGDGWLRDSRGVQMCVKVESGFPFGTFAQGIKDIIPTENGMTIKPTQSKIGNIQMSNDQLTDMAKSVLDKDNPKPYTFTIKGSKITIGASMVPFCKKEWGITT